MSIFGFHRPFHKQLADENESDDQHQQSHQSNSKELHGLLLTFSWFFLLHLGIWTHYFKSYRYALLIHIICMSSIVLLTAIAITIMITAEGSEVIYESFFHQTVGFYLVVGLLPITVINGGLARIFMNTYKIKTMWMFSTKQLHKILGWAMLVLIKIPLATGLMQHEQELFIFILIIDSVSYGLFWYLKLNRNSIGVVVREEYKNILNRNKSLACLNQYFHSLSGKCFLFANYVYPIQTVLGSHPGGIYFIFKVRNRQIDRYVYGMELTQDQVGVFNYRHAHSPDFLRLAQKPIAKIRIQQPFFNLPESNPVEIHSIYTSFDQKMFLVYLKMKGSSRQIEHGYRNLNQFGRFYALTFNGITRLYSAVYFLLPNNVKWMYSLMSKESHKYKKYRKSISKTEQKMIELQQSLLENQMETISLYIPLFIKKYNDGLLTSQFMTQFKQPEQNALVLSESRGFGIGLSSESIHEKKEKRIVMFAGGTGLNPYCDLIDILFKKAITCKDEQQFRKIIEINPILKDQENLLRYKYVIYIGIESLQSMHPITLYQLEELSKCDVIECYLKSKNYEHSIKTEIKNLSEQRIPLSKIHYLPLTYRFEQAVEKQMSMGEDTRIFVCGTPRMIKDMKEKIKQLQFPENQFRIL